LDIFKKFENSLFLKKWGLTAGGGGSRSFKARKNILFSFLLKGIGILVSLLMVPLTLNYLNPVKYGIWLTLSAVISWITILDVGLGNGLRNKFGEALAKNDELLAKTYVSTSYAILGIIICLVYALFLILQGFIDWNLLLNTPNEFSFELNYLAFWVFTFFLLRLLLGLIIPILTADQKFLMVGLIDLVTNLLSLLILILLPFFKTNSLLWLGGGISFATVLIPFLATLYFFSTIYWPYRPSTKFVSFGILKDLLGLSFSFFILSISTIVVYFSQNLIISHLFGPSEVSAFNIAYKYFFCVVIVHTLILTPILPAVTEAFFKGDLEWIKKVLNKLILVWIGLLFLALLMIFLSNSVYDLWVGNQVKISFAVSLSTGLYIILFTWYANFAYIINGIGKIRLQLYIILIAAFLIVPLSLFLVKILDFGPEGVILAGLICTLPGSIAIPIQVNKILNGKAKNIWSK